MTTYHPIKTPPPEITCESHVIHLTIGKTIVYIAGVYRPPSGNLDNALETLSDTLDLIPTWKCPTLIMGDINVDSLSLDNKKQKLEDMLARHSIHRLNLPPTRITSHSKTSIDFICSNLKPSELTSRVIDTGLSDHTAQVCTVNLQRKKNILPFISRRCFTDDNLNNLKYLLNLETWQTVYESPSVNEAYNSFNLTLTNALNATCPLKTSCPKPKSRFKATDAESYRLKESFLQALEVERATGKEEDKAQTAAKKKTMIST